MEKICKLIGENLTKNFCTFYKKIVGKDAEPEEIETFFRLSQNKEEDLKTALSRESEDVAKEIDKLNFIMESRYPISAQEIYKLLDDIQHKYREREHLHQQFEELEKRKEKLKTVKFICGKRDSLLARKNSLDGLKDTALHFEEKLQRSQIIHAVNNLLVEMEKKNLITAGLSSSAQNLQSELAKIEEQIMLLKTNITLFEKQYSDKKNQTENLYVDLSSRELLSKVKELKENLQKDLMMVDVEMEEIENLRALSIQYNKKIEYLKSPRSPYDSPIAEEINRKEILDQLFKKRDVLLSKLNVARHLSKELRNLKNQEEVLLDEYKRAEEQVEMIKKESLELDGDSYFSLEKSYEIAQENLNASKLILQKLQDSIAERERYTPVELCKRLEEELQRIESKISQEETLVQEKLFKKIAKDQETKTLENELMNLQDLIASSHRSIEEKETKIIALSREIKKIQAELLERFSDFSSLPLDTIKESLEIVLNAEDLKLEMEEDMLTIDQKIKETAHELLSLLQKQSALKEQIITKMDAISYLQNNTQELQETLQQITIKNPFISEENAGSYLLTSEDEDHLKEWISNYEFQLRHVDAELQEISQNFEENGFLKDEIIKICEFKKLLLARVDELSEEIGAKEAQLAYLNNENETNKEYEEMREYLLKKEEILNNLAFIFDGQEFIKLLSIIS